MQIKDITEDDEKNIIQLHKILNQVLRELKFSVADAQIVDESCRWFQKFAVMAGQVQKFESQTKEKEKDKKTSGEGIEGLNIKDFHPGDLSVVGSTKKATRSKAKSKTKAKKRKR